MQKKLAIICSHPIQYYAPMFRYMAKTIDLEVIYCHKPNSEEIGKQGFGISFEWDVDLMSGYSSVFVTNISKHPSMDSFGGCDTPAIGQKIKEIGASHVLILGWYLKSYIQAYLYCVWHKIHVSVRGDSQLNPLDSIWKDRIKKVLYPFFLRKFNRILYVGNRNKEYLLHYGAKEGQLVFAPHAVDQDFWADAKGETLRNEKITTFIWVGKFADKKRPLDAIEAFRRVDSTDVRLWMVGTGELIELCRSRALHDKRIHFLGFKNQTELRELYSLADCILLTSDRRETWGLVINEAFAQHLSAVVSDSSGCSADLVVNEESGYVYPGGNLGQLAGCIANFHYNKSTLASKFGKKITQLNAIYSFESNRGAVSSFMET